MHKIRLDAPIGYDNVIHYPHSWSKYRYKPAISSRCIALVSFWVMVPSVA